MTGLGHRRRDGQGWRLSTDSRWSTPSRLSTDSDGNVPPAGPQPSPESASRTPTIRKPRRRKSPVLEEGGADPSRPPTRATRHALCRPRISRSSRAIPRRGSPVPRFLEGEAGSGERVRSGPGLQRWFSGPRRPALRWRRWGAPSAFDGLQGPGGRDGGRRVTVLPGTFTVWWMPRRNLDSPDVGRMDAPRTGATAAM